MLYFQIIIKFKRMKNYKLAWRNLWRNRRRTIITSASVFFAVFFALFFRSIQTGSYDNMYKNAIESYSGYLQLQHADWWDEKTIDNTFSFSGEIELLLLEDENVDATIPRVESFALASSGSTTKGVMLMGIDPEKENLLSDLNLKRVKYRITPEVVEKIQGDDLFSEKSKENAALFVESSYTNDERLLLDLEIDKEEAATFLPILNEYAHYDGEPLNVGEPGVWLGDKLAQFLELEKGDTIVLLGQGYHGASAAGKYKIMGLVKLPVPDMNSRVVYMPYDIAQKFYNCGDNLTSLVIQLKNIDDKSVSKTKERLSERVPQHSRVVDWKEMNEIMIQQMEADNQGGILMIGILYMVIAFGVFGTVLMMTAERRREFGVLVAIGMQKKKLASIIAFEMMYIGLLGIALGCLITIPLITYGAHHPIIFKGEMAYMFEEYGFNPKLVFKPVSYYFLWQAFIVGLMVFVSLIHPVRKILNLKVVTALRA